MRHSQRFPPDPYWPSTCARVILPIRQRSELIGLFDLHSQQPIHHSPIALIGLQALADQLGVALRNADLYEEAIGARADAERANQSKSRLLANVSHEIRATPLNVIAGYSQAALAWPVPPWCSVAGRFLGFASHLQQQSTLGAADQRSAGPVQS